MAKRGRPKVTHDMVSLLMMELEKPYLGTKKMHWIARGVVNACLPRLTAAQEAEGKGKAGSVHAEGMVDMKAVEALTNRVYGKPAEKRNTQVDVFHHFPKLEDDVRLEDFSKTIEVRAEVE